VSLQSRQYADFQDADPAPPPVSETAADGGPALLALLVDELAHGVLVINAQGWILHANQAARHELAQAAVLKAHRGELQVVSKSDSKLFKKAFDHAVDGLRSLVELSAGGSAACTLALVPLGHQAGRRCERIAVFLSRAGVCESGVFRSFARSHGLTRTEEQVLVFLCHCLSTPQIARQMSVAVSTVRSHVRSLCLKTASSGVRALVNRVAILPPLGLWPPA
jgi:DNA-binding CsgD family transcriptional regulator